jgi:16S rRNA (guanine1207-N2)-methyltransferase
MSRWARDPERAADALLESTLGEIAPAGRILLANQGGTLPGLLAARGIAHSAWNRRLVGSAPATPWPPPGPFDLALVRLPRSRDEQAMTAHAVLGVLAAGGRLVVYGGNDEGIRSAAALLETLTGSVRTLAARGHGRVLDSRRPPRVAGLRGTLAAWRTVSTVEIAGAARAWVSYPGIFAAGRIDEGSALLIDALPALAAGARVLDFGCGAGVIAAAARAAQPGIALELLDSDSVALEAARENVAGARLLLGARLDAGGLYEAILSNPPLHPGFREDRTLLEHLAAEAPSRLGPGGVLQMVVQRRIPLDRLLARHFGRADVVAESGRYRVWRAQRA